MYLIVIALTLLLAWLLLSGFAKADTGKIALFFKNIRWYLFSALCVLLGLWFVLSGKTYLSWVALIGLLPTLKRILLGALYVWGANKFRKLVSGTLADGGLGGGFKQPPLSVSKAQTLLKVSAEAEETEIINAYIARKKDIAKKYKDEPEKRAEQLHILERARDCLLAQKNQQQ